MGISEKCQINNKENNQQDGFSVNQNKGIMKVLKKIKRRMGLVSRSSSNGGGTNNLPPLLFHNVHGENIRILRDGTIAERVESFCKGIVFSSRPVKVNEKIYIKFLQISNNWSGVIRFGFTYNDPSGAALRYGLPKYACPDLTNKPGYWAKALNERFCSQGTILFYYVTSNGDVHFGINGEEKGIFFSGVETRGPLWALIDVYGNSTAIEFLDIRHQLNNSRRYTNNCNGFDDIDRIVYPMQQIHIQQQQQPTQPPTSQQQQQNEDLSLPLLRYQSSQLNFAPLVLHRTRGRNVRIGAGRSIACRIDHEICQGYVFTARPLQLGERVVVQILSTEPMFQGCLRLGLTSCDPSTLQTTDLPDDSNYLLDRPEYWVLCRDFARNFNKGDEISFSISSNGEVQFNCNGINPFDIIHVDHTLRLWAFFDLFGSTQRIRVVSSPAPVSPVRNVDRRLLSPSTITESINNLNSQSELRRNSMLQQQQQQANPRVCCVTTPADIQVQPSTNGGAVLSVILPPTHANLLNQQTISVPVNHNSYHHTQNNSHNSRPSHQQHNINYAQPATSNMVAPVQVNNNHPSTGTMMSTCSNTYVEPVSDSSSYSTSLSWAEQNGASVGTGTECTICYENTIDAVLYMCGHMCMCYECALQQWRGKGGGHCPLCRAVIRDVIRIYKS